MSSSMKLFISEDMFKNALTHNVEWRILKMYIIRDLFAEE